MKIAVFMGGSSGEREVSLNSGREVTNGLKAKGHDVTAYDVEWEGTNTLFPAIEEVSCNHTDVVFLALHGGFGENGGIQSILEAMGIPYTGSGSTSSAIAMDKDISKKLFLCDNIPTAPWIVCSYENIDMPRVESEIGYPCIVKPADQGSTIGLSLVHEPSELCDAFHKAAEVSQKIMIEAYITGSELTVPILGDRYLPVIEIQPSHEIYDYRCKYTQGMTEYLVPAPIPDDLTSEVQSLALHVSNSLGLRDLARIDFRIDQNGQPLSFEANTLPAITATSIVQKATKAASIAFPELVTSLAAIPLTRTRT